MHQRNMHKEKTIS